jgi:hypothetical protein
MWTHPKDVNALRRKQRCAVIIDRLIHIIRQLDALADNDIDGPKG